MKIYSVSADIKSIRKLFNFGKKLHGINHCDVENCTIETYLSEIDEEILKKDLNPIACRLQFIEISVKQAAIFLTINQLQKKFENEFEDTDKFKMKDAIINELTQTKRLIILILSKEGIQQEINRIVNDLN